MSSSTAIQQQVIEAATQAHDAQFGLMARRLALTSRLVQAQHAQIEQLEATVAELERRLARLVGAEHVNGATERPTSEPEVPDAV